MKKRGFTLYEIIITLAIILIIFSISVRAFSSSKRLVNEINIKGVQNQITDILSLGKQYCFVKEKRGKIEIINNDTIRFIDTELPLGRGIIQSTTLPKSFEFLENITMQINSNGVLASNTIWIKDSYSQYHKITIAVGVDLITIY